MSKFFMVTLDNVSLDDNVTNDHTGWTSEKILKEIYNHRITKFESLDDVNMVNKKDKQVVAYSIDTKKFVPVDLPSLYSDVGLGTRQLNKMGVTGTTTAPQIIDIPINTLDFKTPRINVLKFVLGTQNVVKTINTFASNEISAFKSDNMINFDGAAKLNTTINLTMSNEGIVEGIYTLYDVPLNMDDFKTVSQVSIIDNTTSQVLSMLGTSTDRLVMPLSDVDLSNADNIDSFTLTATDGIRVTCSVDGGITWKTFNSGAGSWDNINPTVTDVAAKGISPTEFNVISNLYWNLLTSTTNKIRFAYLLKDTNSVDNISLQYDGKGFWVEAKDTTYDVAYASNTLLQVKLYFSGDVKINY